MRGFLLLMQAPSIPDTHHCAIALIGVLMIKAAIPRSAVIKTVQVLVGWSPDTIEYASVLVADGTTLVILAGSGGNHRFFRLPGLEELDPHEIPDPIVNTVFNLDKAMRLCQEQ